MAKDQTVSRQLFNLDLSVTALKKKSRSLNRGVSSCIKRIRRYVNGQELGLARLESEEAVTKEELSERCYRISGKLKMLSTKLKKLEEFESLSYPLKRFMYKIDDAVRAMDVDRIEWALNHYENNFSPTQEGEAEDELMGTEEKSSRADKLLAGIIKEVNWWRNTGSEPVVLVPLAVEKARREQHLVEEIINEMEAPDKATFPLVVQPSVMSLRRRSTMSFKALQDVDNNMVAPQVKKQVKVWR